SRLVARGPVSRRQAERGGRWRGFLRPAPKGSLRRHFPSGALPPLIGGVASPLIGGVASPLMPPSSSPPAFSPRFPSALSSQGLTGFFHISLSHQPNQARAM